MMVGSDAFPIEIVPFLGTFVHFQGCSFFLPLLWGVKQDPAPTWFRPLKLTNGCSLENSWLAMLEVGVDEIS